MSRKNINTTLDIDLYTQIQILALKLSAEKKSKINANDLIEEAMRDLLEKYEKLDK